MLKIYIQYMQGLCQPRLSTADFALFLVALFVRLEPLGTNHADNTVSLLLTRLAYLLIRCLAVDVPLLRAYASAGMCLSSRCLAMDLNITILVQLPHRESEETI
jgi:hypothetical protein